MPKRIEYLDVAKGIGILLVVLGHNDLGSLSPFLFQTIYSFHVPLFFFLSGFFINISIPFLDYFKKRFHSLLKPYLFTIFLIYLASVSFGKMNFQTAIVRMAKSLYGSVAYLDWQPLWFLPNLFVVSLYAFLLLKLVDKLRNRWLTWGILLGTLAISSLFLDTFVSFPISILGKEYVLSGLPFGLDLVLLSGFFFLLGNEVRQITSENTFDSVFLLVGTGVGLILLNVFFHYRTDLAFRVYPSYPVSTAEAVLGIFFVLALSRQIDLRIHWLASLFKYIGNISLIILLFHISIQEAWGQKVMAMTGSIPLSILVGFTAGVLGPILIYEIFIRSNPIASFWFGRRAEPPRQKELPIPEAEEPPIANPTSTPVAEIKEQ